jgi:hypothetical protein
MSRRLTAQARDTLRAYGYSEAAWAFFWTGARAWTGDRCGCTDDRCIGFHHDNEGDCQCLEALLDDPYCTASAPHPGDTVEVWHPDGYLCGIVTDVGETHTAVRGTGSDRGRSLVMETGRVYVQCHGFFFRWAVVS